MIETLANLVPRELWQHFAQLTAIPRPSGQEGACLDYVKSLAGARGVGWRQDDMGNLVLFLDDGSGPTVAIQAHLDMVCEKDPGVVHDFSRDAIKVGCDGNRVYAEGTTLGADNGIGAAAALALLTSQDIKRGPLELIFTVQEETGLHGALAFDTDLLQSKFLINLDSEDPNELTVGCAGGATVEVRVPLSWEPVKAEWVGRQLVVSGLRGGHSGLEIDRAGGNAIKIMVEVLSGLGSALELRLAGIEAGRAHNVIPREATAQISVSPSSLDRLGEVVAHIEQSLVSRWASLEPDLKLTLAAVPVADRALSESSEEGLLGLLAEIPHGVQGMNEDFPEKVETSANLAQVMANSKETVVVASVRSISPHRLFRTRTAIATAGMKLGATAEVVDSYPGWEPELDSLLLSAAKQQYEQVNGRPPSVQVIHAGLECGVLVAKKPDLQAISFGPLITGAHSPSEQVDVATVDAMWRLLVGLLGALADQ